MGKIFIDHGIIFEDNASGLTVKGFHNKDDKRLKLVIPSCLESAEHPGLKPSHTIVNRINARAFMNAKNLQSIELPDTIGVIEEYAFNECSNVKEVRSYGRRLDHLLVIEKGAFLYCSQLEQVQLNRPLIFIANDVFKGCRYLQTFTGKISIVHRGAFEGCNLESLSFADRATIKANSIEKSGVKKLIFYGESSTIMTKVWNWMKRAKLQICCLPNSNLVNLAYEGVNVEVIQK